MTLITKVISLEAAKLLITIVIVVLGVFSIRSIGDDLRIISRVDIPLMEAISKITAAQIEQSLWLQRAVLKAEIGKKGESDEASNRFGELSDEVTAEISGIVSFVEETSEAGSSENEKNKYQQLLVKLRKIESGYDDYTGNAIGLLVSLKQGNLVVAEKMLPEVEAYVEDMTTELQKLSASIADSTQTRAQSAERSESIATQTMIYVSLVALSLALALGFFVARSISQRLGCDPTKLEKIAKSLAEGQLGIERDTKASGVYGAISSTVDNLIDIIRGIISGANEVSSASKDVSQGNADLSQRTQEQASSLEQVAASMEQMTSTVSQNAENAQQANQLADAAHDIADNGRKVVDQTIEAMEIINQSSSKIAAIISVIEEIAFQTNLLALNATIEAAHAGEHGRGFSVVASEVKNLAGRSAKASNDIKNLIQNSVDKVVDGTKMAKMSGDALTEIVEAVDSVSKVVNEIMTASQEQSEGIKQVNDALIQMDEMTQQNASLVEQAAATSLAMGTHAQDLSALVAYFKLGDQATIELEPSAQLELDQQAIKVRKLE